MATIQVVLDDKLLKAADSAAKRTKQNRSALMRDALRAYLKQRRIRELEERERVGYDRHPQQPDELVWEAEAVWPEE